MAASQNVIDELVVVLRLDANDYKNTDKKIGQLVDETERKQKDVDAKRKKRDTEQVKRNKATLQSVKDLAGGLRKLAFTAAGLLGIGSIGGVVGLLAGFANMETGLRRAAVSTGLSNKELQAWGSTARRLGADAQAGASAIADLAREQKQFHLTGNAPTIQALQRLGVDINANSSPEEILESAQKAYRAAAPAQREQMEAGLAASGVSNDLIVMIKSETDAREAYNRSLAESTEENKKALASLYNAISSVENALTGFAGSLATIAEPYVKEFGEWAHGAAMDLQAFSEDVEAAGGGVDGFMKVLDRESPALADNLRTLTSLLKGMGETVLVVTYGWKQIFAALDSGWQWLKSHLGGTAGQNIQVGAKWISDAWDAAVKTALGTNEGGAKLSAGAQARVENGDLRNARAAERAGTATQAAGRFTGEELRDMLVARGMTPIQAAAFAANALGESGGRTNAVSPDGGAHGLFQWRGPRRAAFKAKYGIEPSQADINTQLDFLFTDPQERARMARAVAAGGTATQMGETVGRVFETHGTTARDIAEDQRRGRVAGQLASSYGGPTGAGVGQQINIQSMTVQADNPQAFVGGITRQSGVQSYNSGVR